MVGALPRERIASRRAGACAAHAASSSACATERDLPASTSRCPTASGWKWRARWPPAQAAAARRGDGRPAADRDRQHGRRVPRSSTASDGLTILLIEHVMRAVMALAQQRRRAAPRRDHRAAARRRRWCATRRVLECYLGEEDVVRHDRCCRSADLDLFYGDAQALDGVSLDVAERRDRRHRRRQRRGQVLADPHHRRHREAARRARSASTGSDITGLDRRTTSATSASARSPRGGRCSPP